MTEPVQPEVQMSISAVERDTGISKDTLRVWERRYGFPDPERDSNGERIYSLEQVSRLRLIRQLLDAGHRPGRVIGEPMQVLRVLADQVRVSASSARERVRERATDPSIDGLLVLVAARDASRLRAMLDMTLLRLGLESFIHDCASPLTRAVGEAWARGEVGIPEEHLFSEALQGVLREAIGRVKVEHGSPRIVLTTLPTEAHGLGLLMAQAILCLERCQCLSFGVQLPIDEIAAAATFHRADIVGLSCSSLMGTNVLLDALADLDARLSPDVKVWLGGEPQVGSRRLPSRVEVVTDLRNVGARIRRWRESDVGSRGELAPAVAAMARRR
jgi:methylmalonyl-CoA mutase cobalamin-binding subunit